MFKYTKEELKRHWPELVPFLEQHIDQDYFENNDSILSDDDYLKICSEYAKWFDENKEAFISNYHQVLLMTRNETGYQTFTKNWKQLKKHFGYKKVAFSKKRIETHLIDVMSRSMIYLYQKWKPYKQKEFEVNVGNVGLLVVSSIYLNISLSEKRNTRNVDYSYHLDLNIEASEHNSFEISEK